jgi:putative ATPase
MLAMLFSDRTETAAIAPPASLQPLASRMRPRDFAEYAGQQHIIAPGKLLRRAIDADRFTAIVLYGPPGTGKTSLAELISAQTQSHFETLSAVTAGVADIRRVVKEAGARMRLRDGLRTILFVDEIHRFNKAQQDALLPHVENGTLRLIGATTENPYFCIVGPLLSRAQVFQLEPLDGDDIGPLLRRCCTDDRAFPDHTIELSPEAEDFWLRACEGDARRALSAFEIAVLTTDPDAEGRILLTLEVAAESIQRKPIVYGADGHYDTASAFIKSMRGSDPDAAIYWLAKMLEVGEDIRFIARRLVIFASEDVGNADPRALTMAVSTMQACELVGMPESRIILTQTVAFCATCPKSNASIAAIDKALTDVRENRVQPVPVYLRDGHYKGAKDLGHKGYEYAHNAPDNITGQAYMRVPASYYQPVDAGYERQIRERMNYWQKLRQQREEPSRAKQG